MHNTCNAGGVADDAAGAVDDVAENMSWNEFQSANKGKYTNSEMSAAWAEYKLQNGITTGSSSPIQIGIEDHHGLPQEFAEDFAALGLDVQDAQYRYNIPTDVHRLSPGGLHTNSSPLGDNWNNIWRNFMKTNPTKEQVLQQLAKMVKAAGIG